MCLYHLLHVTCAVHIYIYAIYMLSVTREYYSAGIATIAQVVGADRLLGAGGPEQLYSFGSINLFPFHHLAGRSDITKSKFWPKSCCMMTIFIFGLKMVQAPPLLTLA